MIIGKELQDENKYLNKTIGKITDLLNSYGVSSEEQDKEIIKHRKFLWDNRNPVLAKTLTEEQLWIIRLEDYLGDGKYTADDIAGPIRTKEIEYIIIPFQSKDELYKMKELIDSLGKYEYNIDEIERTITLFGYR